MQKLFADNIRSPGPATAVATANAEEFPFYSHLTQSTSASTSGSPRNAGWLTQQLQAQRSENSELSYTHGEPPPPSRRKGNPKLLFMGMRR